MRSCLRLLRDGSLAPTRSCDTIPASHHKRFRSLLSSSIYGVLLSSTLFFTRTSAFSASRWSPPLKLCVPLLGFLCVQVLDSDCLCVIVLRGSHPHLASSFLLQISSLLLFAMSLAQTRSLGSPLICIFTSPACLHPSRASTVVLPLGYHQLLFHLLLFSFPPFTSHIQLLSQLVELASASILGPCIGPDPSCRCPCQNLALTWSLPQSLSSPSSLVFSAASSSASTSSPSSWN